MGVGKQTVGFRYLMSLHMGLGRGPIDELVEIQANKLTAWRGPVCNPHGLIEINAPELFGGDEKEGGIKGPCFVLSGKADQTLPGAMSSSVGELPDIAATLGGRVPGFRGVVTLWFDGLVSSMNPYLKEWRFRIRRAWRGWYNDNPWYPQKAVIYLNGGSIKAMNGIHILYEIATNPEWGRGMPAEFIDENSYIAAANTLCSEGLGLCLPWYRQEDISVFTQTVIDHIAAVQYISRETGKLTVRLIRKDYELDDLPIFTPSTGLLDIINDDTAASETGFNEIIVNGKDPDRAGETISVRMHNLASIQSLGEKISQTSELPGLPTRELCLLAAGRMLAMQTGLRAPTVILDRRGWKIAPGMPFRIQWPERGIADMVVRAGEISEGGDTDGSFTIKAVQDVFSQPDTVYAEVEPPQWSAPDFSAVVPPYTRLVEANYRDLFIRLDPANLAALDDTTAVLGELAVAPNSQARTYDLATKADGEPAFVVYNSMGQFVGSALLTVAISELATTVVLGSLAGFPDPSEFIGDAALIDDEIVEIQAWNAGTSTMTIGRGCADTVPAKHLVGARFWMLDDDLTGDGREYSSGETVFAQARTRTSSDVLTEAESTTDELDLVGRQARPYPPGAVKVDGDSIYALTSEYPEPVITWAGRNRIVQQDALIVHAAGSFAPEDGTTYTIRVYDADGVTLLRTVAGIAAETWTYEAAMIVEDGSPSYVWIELESVRDGLTSFQHYRFRLPFTIGYGVGYGMSYGGAL